MRAAITTLLATLLAIALTSGCGGGGGGNSLATPVITWDAPVAITYGTALSATQLNATANVSGTFTHTPADGAILGVGLQTLSAVFTPTDTTKFIATTATVKLMVNTAPPAVTTAA